VSHRNASTSLSYLGHYFSSGAFYAAESGQELALREVRTGSDLDGNGTAGTISAAPSLPNGTISVDASGKVYTATGLWEQHYRVTECTLQ
jgi:hypothetical protein